MKRPRKLVLRRDILRQFGQSELAHAVGGDSGDTTCANHPRVMDSGDTTCAAAPSNREHCVRG
jgi:hypothetical protein